MAAILCRAMCKPCEWTAEQLEACCLSCSRLCGECGESCGRLITSCCEGCSHLCVGCCLLIGAIFEKPFSSCLFFSLLANLVPAAVFVVYLSMNFDPDCDKPLDIWLLIYLISAVINLVFSIFIFYKVNKDFFDDDSYDPSVSEEENRTRRVKQLFLYNGVVALYLVLAIFFTVWGILGLVWTSDAKSDSVCDARYSDLINCVYAGGVIMLCFLSGALLFVVCFVFWPAFRQCLEECTPFSCLCCLPYYMCCYDWDGAREQRRQRNSGLAGWTAAAAAVTVGAALQTMFGRGPSVTQQQQGPVRSSGDRKAYGSATVVRGRNTPQPQPQQQQPSHSANHGRPGEYIATAQPVHNSQARYAVAAPNVYANGGASGQSAGSEPAPPDYYSMTDDGPMAGSPGTWVDPVKPALEAAPPTYEDDPEVPAATSSQPPPSQAQQPAASEAPEEKEGTTAKIMGAASAAGSKVSKGLRGMASWVKKKTGRGS